MILVLGGEWESVLMPHGLAGSGFPTYIPRASDREYPRYIWYRLHWIPFIVANAFMMIYIAGLVRIQLTAAPNVTTDLLLSTLLGFTSTVYVFSLVCGGDIL